MTNYLWTDNPTEANVAVYDPDILNECLMHLKYHNEKFPKFCVNSASLDSNGVPNLLSYQSNIVKFNCGTSTVPIMTSNSASGWTLSASHSIVSSATDIYKSFDNNTVDYCSLQHTPTQESPAFITLAKTASFSFDYLYLNFKTILEQGDIKAFYIQDGDDNYLYSYDNFEDFMDKNEFLIPITNFSNTEIKISVTSNVGSATYINFPCVIKLLNKDQVVTLTNAKGEVENLVKLDDFTIPSVASSTYNVFAGTDGNMETFNTILTKGSILPTSPVANQIHLLTYVEPLQAKKYNGTIWENYEKVPVGYAKTNSSGVISEVGTFSYNQNGFNLNMNNFTQNLASSGWSKLPNGLILQWGILATTGDGVKSVTFPIAFPNAVFSVTPTAYSNSYDNATIHLTASIATSGFSCSLNGASSVTGIYYIAIGY